jgi:hypothetical protein
MTTPILAEGCAIPPGRLMMRVRIMVELMFGGRKVIEGMGWHEAS